MTNSAPHEADEQINKNSILQKYEPSLKTIIPIHIKAKQLTPACN